MKSVFIEPVHIRINENKTFYELYNKLNNFYTHFFININSLKNHISELSVQTEGPITGRFVLN